MISQENAHRLTLAFKLRDDYEVSIQKALEWLDNYRNDEPYLFYEFIKVIQSNGWNRATSYGYLMCIWDAYDEAGLLTDEVHDSLEPISENLTGYVPNSDIIRLPGDPQQNRQLAEYARSEEWAK